VASKALARERHKNFRARQLRATWRIASKSSCHEKRRGFQVEIYYKHHFCLSLKIIRTFWMVQKDPRASELFGWSKRIQKAYRKLKVEAMKKKKWRESELGGGMWWQLRY